MIFLKKLKVTKDYFAFREQVRISCNGLKSKDRILLYRYFFKWRYYKDRSDSVRDQIPWITFNAISYLRKRLKKNMIVFEYGSGGSTLFLSKRVNKLYSVEHDKKWHQRVKDEIHCNKIKNVTLTLREPETLNRNSENEYKSDNRIYENSSFESYVKQIDDFPDNHFDVIIIDGRARKACFKHSLPKVKPDGVIVFDNTERLRYHEVFGNYKRIDLIGPVPFNSFFTSTSIFFKRSKSCD